MRKLYKCQCGSTQCESVIHGITKPMYCIFFENKKSDWTFVSDLQDNAENLQDNIQDMVTKTCQAMDKGKENVAKATCNFGNLPKLAAEVFNYPDCPEWAEYAAVDKNGDAYFYDIKPEWEQPSQIREHQTIWFTGKLNGIKRIPGKFDAANWHNSLIERPTKDAFDKLLKNCAEQQANKILQKAREHRLSEQYHNGPEKNTLPEWVEIGGYVYDARNGYGKIVSGSVKSCYIEFDGGAGDFVPEAFSELKPARLRPYNENEMQRLVGKVLHGNDFDFSALILYAESTSSTIETLHYSYTAEELKQDYTIDGQPAGILEHLENGEWVQ